MSQNFRYLNRILLLTVFLLTRAPSIPAPVWADAQEDELFLVAEKAFDDGFYDVAIRYIEQFLTKYPQTQKRIQAQILLGQCYFFKSQYLKAFDIFQGLVQYPEFKDATLFWLGETYFKGGDYKQAAKHYEQMISLYPKSSYVPQALFSLGWTYFEQEKYPGAQDIFVTLIHEFPTHPLSEDAAFKLGECAHNSGEYEKAQKFFKEFLAQYPQSPKQADGYFYIAESYYYSGDFLTAVTYYAKAADVAYDSKIIFASKVGMGWCYLKLRKYDLARNSFGEAEKLAAEKNIQSDDIHLGLASLYSETGENQKAGEAYQTIIDHFPDSPRLAESYLGKANSDYALKKYDEAISGYQWLIKHYAGEDPSRHEILEKAYYGLAWTYLKSGRVELAIRSFEDISHKSDSKIVKASALTQIGDAYQEINDLPKAIDVYDRILRDHPDSIYADYAQFRQGIALLKSNKIEAATLSFQSLQANFPKSKYLYEVKYYLGLAYFKKEDWAQAIKHSDDYLKNPGESQTFIAEAGYILALAHFHLNHYETALDFFQKIVNDFPQQTAMVHMSELYAAKSLFGLQKPSEAVEKFWRISENYPASEAAQDALLWLGDYFLEQGRTDEAIKAYQKFLSSFLNSDKHNLVYYNLGQCYETAGQPDQALNYYKLINDSGDKEITAKARLAIADIFSKESDPQAAVATYLNIIQGAPEFKKEAYSRIAAIYKDNKDFEKAIAAYEQALSSVPPLDKTAAAELQFHIADSYEQLHNPDKAVEAYLKIPYLYPKEQTWLIKAYLRTGRIFEDTAQWDEAAAVYDKVIASNSEESKYAQERIDWIKEHIK